MMASAVSDPNVIIPRNSGKFRIGLHAWMKNKSQGFGTNASTSCIADPDHSKPAAASRFLLRGKRAVTFVEIERRADA